jgi:hypothetical protein
MDWSTIVLIVCGVIIVGLLLWGIISSFRISKEEAEHLAKIREFNPYTIKDKKVYDWTEEIVEGRYMNHSDCYLLLERSDGVVIKWRVSGSDYAVYNIGDKFEI